MYDYIFFLHPSSSDPRATILLVSDAGCLTVYKRARYSRLILNLAFACSIIHMTHTHMHNMYGENQNIAACICVRVRMSARSGSRMVVADLRPLYPVKGCDRRTEDMLCPPSTFSALLLAMKERFQRNQASTRRRHMLNALAKHRRLGQEVVTDMSVTPDLHMFHVRVCFTAHLKCLFLHV